MNILQKLVNNKKIVIGLWCSVVIIVILKHFVFSTPHNNYYIFKYTYYHAINNENLYWQHPGEYLDKNHYGPLFSVLFAPFAILPDFLGEFLYMLSSVLLLLYAIYSLPIKEWQKNAMLLICLNELLTAGFNVQFNIVIASLLILTYTWIDQRKEWLAPLPILIGTFVKLYGIVGLSMFFFVKNKPKFIVASVLWSFFLFVLPMALSSPQYVIDMYFEWFHALVVKNSENVSLVSYQDFSVMGFFRRTFQDPTIPNLPFLLAGVILFGLPYLRIKHYHQKAFQLLILVSTLMFPVLFSSASEGSTYMIVFVGIAIWFVIQPKPFKWYDWGLLLFAILFASLNSTDIYPREFRDFLRLHAFKAVPCALIWLRVIYELMTCKDFKEYELDVESAQAYPNLSK